MTVISVGDGRTIEFSEGALRAPPPEVKPKKPYVYKPAKKNGRDKSVVIRGFKYKFDPRPADRKKQGPPKITAEDRNQPGLKEWALLRSRQIAMDRAGRPSGVPNGMSQERAEALWAVARRKAKKDMAIIEKKLDLPDAAREALEATLTTMRSPMNQQIRLAAAKLVLDFTMAKPVAKSEVTVNAAEKWLAELGDNAS